MDILNKNKITYVNFILAFSIVWHHAYNVNVYEISKGALYYFELFTMNLFDISVAMFFALSAFLFYQNYNETLCKKKLISRIKSLIIPYLIWNLIGYLYFQIVNLFPFIRNNYSGSISDFSFVDMLKQMFIGDYNLVTWFLRVLIIYTYIFPLFYKINKKRQGSRIMLIITILISIYGSIINDDCLLNCCFYYFGIFVALNYKDIVLSRFSNKQKISSAILLALSIIVSIMTNKYIDMYYAFLRIFQIVLLWMLFDYLPIKNKPSEITEFSFLMYVSHEMILEPIEKVLFIVLGSNYIGAIIDYLLAPVLAILIIIFIGNVLKRYRFYKLLTGNR